MADQTTVFPGTRHRLFSGDRLFKALCGLAASAIIVVLALMVYELVDGSTPSLLRFGPGFLWGTRWDPANSQVFGALPLVFGTLVTSALALLMGVPLSLGIALALSEYAPRRLGFYLSFLVELLAAVPSVVYGLWGIYVLVPFLRDNVYPYLQRYLWFTHLFGGPIYGGGVLTASIVLAIMIVPTVSSVMRDLFLAVPSSQREAIVALGATKWETARLVVGYARSGVVGAVTLGLGRALGETMAVTMVIGNKFQPWPGSLFDAWYTMASIIANELLEATYSLYVAALVEVALVLLLVALAVNVASRLVVWRTLRLVRGIAKE